MKPPKPINKLLFGSSKKIKSLLDRAGYLNELTRYLRTILPETIAPHCQVANIKMDRSGMNLVLITDSPVWSTKIRFYIPTILAHMKQHQELQQLRSVRIKTRPREYRIEEEQIRVVQMSDESAHLIAQAANSTQDENLKAALKRLSNRRSSNPEKH